MASAFLPYLPYYLSMCVRTEKRGDVVEACWWRRPAGHWLPDLQLTLELACAAIKILLLLAAESSADFRADLRGNQYTVTPDCRIFS